MAIVADAPVTVGPRQTVVSRLGLEPYRTGGALLAWGTGDAVYTARQDTDGAWRLGRPLGIEGDDVTLVPGPDGPAAVLTSRFDGHSSSAQLTRLAQDGTALSTETVPGQYPQEGRQLDDGTIVVTVTGGVVEQRPDGTWSPVQAIGGVAGLAPSPDGLAALSTGVFGPLSLRTRHPDGSWTDPAPFTEPVADEPQPEALLSDDAGDLAVVWGSVSGHDGRPDHVDVETRRTGMDWTHPVSEQSYDFPAGALSSGGTLAAAWSGHAWVQRTDGTVDTFQGDYPPQGFPANPVLAVDDAGDLVEVGLDRYMAPNQLVVNAREPGGCFSVRRDLGAGASKPAVALRGDGSGAYAAVVNGAVAAGALHRAPGPSTASCGAIAPAPLTLKASAPRTIVRRRLARHGLQVTVTLSAPATVRFGLGAGPVLVFRNRALPGGGPSHVRLRARHIPRSVRRLQLTVTASAGGDSATRTRTVRIRRG